MNTTQDLDLPLPSEHPSGLPYLCFHCRSTALTLISYVYHAPVVRLFAKFYSCWVEFTDDRIQIVMGCRSCGRDTLYEVKTLERSA